jgi:chemotaxis protein MotB
MAANQAPAPIIKKKKGGHAGSHGGAWKIAYADMVTAMMAFFLVMWICNFDVKTRLGIANYFNDPSSVYGPNRPASWFSIDSGGMPLMTEGNMEKSNEQGGDPESKGLMRVDPSASDNFTAEIARLYAKAIQTHLNSDPALAPVRDSVSVIVDERGLRIDLSEGDQPRFFVPGASQWTPAGRNAAVALAKLLAINNHRTSFAGHTTPAPIAEPGQNKWTISNGRAMALMQVFLETGLSINRVLRINSCADTQPKIPDKTEDPRNMRVSLFVPYGSRESKEHDPK